MQAIKLETLVNLYSLPLIKILYHWFDLFVCCVNVWVSASTH